jgi:CDP-diacylglycerol--glycerol-3-phosphate 3-phosphatidyltransferase
MKWKWFDLSVVNVPALLVAGLALGIVFAYGVRTVWVGRYSDQRVARAGGSMLLGQWLVEAFYWSSRFPGTLFSAFGISPDALTWTSFALTGCAAPAAALGHFSTAGAFMLAGGYFDLADGLVARDRGLSSDSGEMLDATIDRYADAAPMVGLVLFYRFSLWQMCVPLAALVGAYLLSYVRAKAETMGLALPNGLMRRHERIAYITCALVIGPELSPWLGRPFDAVHPATLIVLGIVALISNWATFSLLAAARRELARLGRGPQGGRT